MRTGFSPDETDKYSLSFDIAEICLNNLSGCWNNNFPEILLQWILLLVTIRLLICRGG